MPAVAGHATRSLDSRLRATRSGQAAPGDFGSDARARAASVLTRSADAEARAGALVAARGGAEDDDAATLRAQAKHQRPIHRRTDGTRAEPGTGDPDSRPGDGAAALEVRHADVDPAGALPPQLSADFDRHATLARHGLHGREVPDVVALVDRGHAPVEVARVETLDRWELQQRCIARVARGHAFEQVQERGPL